MPTHGPQPIPAIPSGSAVIGHVIVDSAPVTHVIVDSVPSTPVTGNFFQATQPVSLASVPTHAVTATPTAAAANSCTPIQKTALTVANVKASAGSLYGFSVSNTAATAIFLQFYNTAGTPVLGTSVIFSIACPVGITNFPPGMFALANFVTGIGVGASTSAASTGTPSVAPNITFFIL